MILVHLGERAQWHDSKRPQGYWREAEKPLQNGCIIMIMTILYYTHRWLWESSHDSGILEFPRLLGKSWEWFFGVFCHPSSITQRVAPHPDFTFRFNDWVCLKMTPIYAIATGNMIELTIFFLGSLFSIRHYGHVAADNATILQARDPSTNAIFGGYCWQTFLMDTLYSHSWTTHTDNSFSQTLSVNTRFEDSFARDNAKTETVLDMGWATPYYYSIFGNQHPAKPAKI